MKEIYLEMKEVVKFNKRKIIRVQDIANVYASESLKKQVLNLPVSEGKYTSEIISRLDVIKCIKNNFMFVSIINIGATKTLVIFEEATENIALIFLKVIIGSLITFFGSFVAIMTFQNDVNLPDTLRNIYVLLTGDANIKPYIIQIPYSVGIAIGSITFFMKFKNKNISPIEIELDKYEKDIKESESKVLESERKV